MPLVEIYMAGSAEGITCVKVGTGHSFCYFCDTRIEKDWACIERVWHHQGGKYSRNFGESTGFCPSGMLPESAHVQCAWQLDTKGPIRKCDSCGHEVSPCRRLVNYIASREKRCSETSGLYWCFGCVGSFVQRHRTTLDGFLGADQSTQQGVAWAERPMFPPADLQAGCGLPPMAASVREDVRRIFAATSEEAEALAIHRHRALQAAILHAMHKDRERAKLPPRRKQSTPVERKAKRMRIAGTPENGDSMAESSPMATTEEGAPCQRPAKKIHAG